MPQLLHCNIIGLSSILFFLYFFINPVTSSSLEVDCKHLNIKFYNNTDVNAPIFCPIARDCKAWFDAGINESGIYPINPDNGKPFQVYCDMTTDGGGWTVFQRRIDGSVNFNRNWIDYEKGFGSLTGEFWLGLSKMSRLTPKRKNKLRIDLGDFANNFRYAKYEQFEILDSYTQYAIVIHGYSGNAGDSLSYHNMMKFSAKNRDNDRNSNAACAVVLKGGWWFNACLNSNLNGQYKRSGSTTAWQGVIWYGWKNQRYSLRFTEMKVRRKY